MIHILPAQEQTPPSLPSKTRGLSNLLSADEAAAVLGVTPGTLSVWRSTKRVKIPYYKIGKSVKYKPEDLQEHIAASRG